MATKIFIIVDGSEIRVSIPFDYKDVCRDIRGRRWDDASKQWIWPIGKAREVADALRMVGCIVKNVGPTAASSPSTPSSTDWAEALFRQVGCGEGQKVYRRLSATLHPDVGGDGRLQQQLNDGWRRCCGGGR